MDNEYKLGWLSPLGEFISCGAYEHISVAEGVCNRLNFSPMDDNFSIKASDDILMNHGWAYIGISELDHDYRIGGNKHLTDYQKNFLKKYFESDIIRVNSIARIRWDREMDGC